jgi:hemin uptake protein HemP
LKPTQSSNNEGGDPNNQESEKSPASNPAIAPYTRNFPKIIRFDEIVACGDEVWIDNHGELYRLRRTRAGKLILTK